MNLSQALHNWAGLQGIGKKPRTQKYHREIVALILRDWPACPDADIGTVTDQELTDFILKVAHYGAPRFNAIVSALKSAPPAARKLKRRRVTLKDRPLLSQLEFSRLLEELDKRPQSHAGLVVRFLAHTGSRSEVEAYANTNEMFGPAINYFLATIDGRQPAALPERMSIPQIEDVVIKVFPGASNIVDRPIRFYGKVVDENNQPVRGCKVDFQWSGMLLPGNSHAEVTTDTAGLFSLTNAMGTHLSVSVANSNYYASVRNRSYNYFEYMSSVREPFKPDQKNPAVYYLHKKGVGARTLVTSQYGVYSSWSVKVPFDGATVHVDLLQRKIGNGPLEISQIKHGNNKSQATNWSLTLKIPDGGFVEGGNQEFPYRPPETGYEPVVELGFDKTRAKSVTAVQKDFSIRFGNPAIYGRLHVEASASGETVRPTYTINPDGVPNLEPPNELTPTKSPAPLTSTLQPTKPKTLFNNASGQVVSWGSIVLPFTKTSRFPQSRIFWMNSRSGNCQIGFSL